MTKPALANVLVFSAAVLLFPSVALAQLESNLTLKREPPVGLFASAQQSVGLFASAQQSVPPHSRSKAPSQAPSISSESDSYSALVSTLSSSRSGRTAPSGRSSVKAWSSDPASSSGSGR